MRITITREDGRDFDMSYLSDLLDDYMKSLILNNEKVVLYKHDGSVVTYENEAI